MASHRNHRHHSDGNSATINHHTAVNIRSEFSHHVSDVARINNGSFGSCPATVLAAQRQFQLRYLEQPDNFYFNVLKPSILRTREVIKDLINAEHVDEISIVDNATTAVAIFLQHITWSFFEKEFNPGDTAIMLHYAYGAVKKSVEAYVTRAGGHVIEVKLPFPLSCKGEIISEFRKALQLGKSNNRKIREEGVDRVFVDAAHAIGCTEVDMKEIGADFYTSNLHKWFFCPPSVAFLYCRNSNKLSDVHHPVVSNEYGNGLAIESSWIGTRDYSAQLVVPKALEFMNMFEGGIDGIRKRNHERVVEMGEMLVKAWGTHLGSPPDMCASMVMVGMPACLGISSDSDALRLRSHLRDCFKVEVPIYYRAPHEGEANPVTGYARISHQVYNTVDDYYRFRDAVNSLVKDGLTCALLSG